MSKVFAFLIFSLFLVSSAFAAQGDIIISASDISPTAKFYSSDIDGISVEVLAVKASDGSIRTAFNACQVCYGSGAGYYRQSGAVLICQNCGNRFRTDQIEKFKGGCNPIPITAKDKLSKDGQIIISREFLSQSKKYFSYRRR
ncbi:MAG: DUF2318 domain-containing protein [Elusimicrobiota bacterium]|nr:DUF2318 domain-containing protein [Elusimicrobiota bacterium]